MNKTRRKALSDLQERISDTRVLAEQLAEEIGALRDEEQEYLDNMPESLQSGDKGTAAQEAIDHMENAIASLDGFDFDEIATALEGASA